ncbi:MAG: hypothetical protein JXD22_01065 [Sedimentisphaerales bacterium]|nr:hypothetical protein [Sedimentisphaerales bacterium]
MRKIILLFMGLLSGWMLGGCIGREKLTEGVFDGYWLSSPDPTVGSAARKLEISGQVVPTKWTIRYNKSLIRSTISLVRAADKLKAGAEAIELDMSPVQAEMLAKVFADTRLAMENLTVLIDAAEAADRKKWSGALAGALVKLEGVIRLAEMDETGGGAGAGQEPLAMPAEPMMEMIALYLNETGGGNLLSELSTEDIRQLRAVLTQLALRLGYDIIGKQLSAETRLAVSDMMRGAERLDELEKSLNDFLRRQADEAPAAAQPGELGKVVRLAADWLPKGLLILEDAMRQWNKMESVEVEIRYLSEQPVLAATVNVAAGKELTMAELIMFQPKLVFRGSTRIFIQPDEGATGETVIGFERADEDSGAEIRFDSAVYGLVRLFAFPLESSRLKQIRVFTHSNQPGHKITHLALLLESIRDKDDPRRVLVYHDVRKGRLEREPFGVESFMESKEQTFNFLTPEYHYSYRQAKSYP